MIVSPTFFATLGMDMLYSFVIIVTSLMVYFGTKELYELSNHKGIKYFRLAFLSFAIAYFFRLLIKFLLLSLNIRELMELSTQLIGVVSLWLFMYFSAMSIFYLLYSVMWKRWSGKDFILYIFHALAFVIGLIVTFTPSAKLYLLINLFLFLFVIVIVLFSYIDSKKKKKGINLYGIYLLLFAFWIINITDILIPSFLQTYQLLIYAISIGIFLAILYKVLRKCGGS
ncbi:hypothetical protein COU57_04485 [Candidatus Pacearchaeota archaeon CG10_big_fil_rev_8_21_14_0_10_32_14]|nr:MAG: hypothetical protein COU57_04485 [Candidatus Pacearchaeota archaeon CG10_big_fil_rev_8_21_14_0_10_32_14]